MRPLLRWPTRLVAYGLFCLLDHSIWLLIQLLPGPTLIGMARRRPWTRWQLKLAPARQQLWRGRLAWLMRTRCRRLKRTKGLGLIVVDYLQLMRPSAGSRPENRVQEISQISQGLKALAKELEVPVLALAQLSRQVEQREDKRPQLADLRESGSIEQDADMVMFVYRDEYYLQQRAPKQLGFDNDEKFHGAVEKWQRDMEAVHNRAELIIEKQRHGPTGKIDLFFEGEFTRFADLDLQHDDGR
jgi:replicative DNA helicase